MMNAMIEYLSNKASAAEIAEHLSRCDADFVPSLNERVGINDYASKIASKATRFEAWSDGVLVGLVAVYCNDQESRIAYVTSVSVVKECMGKGIAAKLMKHSIEHVKAAGMQQISLEVGCNNVSAINLYEKSGFVVGKAQAPFISMNRYLKSGE